MRGIIGTIAATLAITALMAASAGAQTPVPGGAKSFVGPADDAFFVDLGVVFDGINIDKPGRPILGGGNQGGGRDDVSGFNVVADVDGDGVGDETQDPDGGVLGLDWVDD